MARVNIRVTGAATDTALVASPGAGKAIEVIRAHFTVSSAATVSMSFGADGTTTRIIDGDFAANGGIEVGPEWDGATIRPFAVGPAATALNITNSAGNLKGVVEYRVLQLQV